MNTKPVLIFDGDDTLWRTMPLYDEAKRHFFQLMSRQGFPAKEVEKHFEERDRRNVKSLGFSKRRFGLSMLQTYRQFAHTQRRPVRGSVDRQIIDIRNKIFDAKPKLVPFATMVLESLAPSNRLVLLTKGTKGVQLRRVSTSGLRHFFERIFVVKDKNNATFKQVLHTLKTKPSNAWSVGDSLRSDINPALRYGLNAIWVPSTNWTYEQDVLFSSSRFYKIQSLTEVIAIINNIGG